MALQWQGNGTSTCRAYKRQSVKEIQTGSTSNVKLTRHTFMKKECQNGFNQLIFLHNLSDFTGELSLTVLKILTQSFVKNAMNLTTEQHQIKLSVFQPNTEREEMLRFYFLSFSLSTIIPNLLSGGSCHRT